MRGRIFGPPRALAGAVGILAAVGVTELVFGLIIGVTVVGRHGNGPMQGWDNRVQAWALDHRDGLVWISKVIAWAGDAPKLAVIAVLLSVVLAIVWRSVLALAPVIGYLGGETLVFAIREVIHRPRPSTAAYPAPGAVPGVHETSWSFPSGHATAIAGLAFAILGLLALTRRWWFAWLVAAAVSILGADSRLVLGVHWFSDVTFGLVLGALWGVAVAVVAARLPVPGRPAGSGAPNPTV